MAICICRTTRATAKSLYFVIVPESTTDIGIASTYSGTIAQLAANSLGATYTMPDPVKVRCYLNAEEYAVR